MRYACAIYNYWRSARGMHSAYISMHAIYVRARAIDRVSIITMRARALYIDECYSPVHSAVVRCAAQGNRLYRRCRKKVGIYNNNIIAIFCGKL